MRVLVKDLWTCKQSEAELCDVLKPQFIDADGQLERVAAQASENAATIGRLLEHMVETNQLPLDKACKIAGYYGFIRPLTNDEQAGRTDL